MLSEFLIDVEMLRGFARFLNIIGSDDYYQYMEMTTNKACCTVVTWSGRYLTKWYLMR